MVALQREFRSHSKSGRDEAEGMQVMNRGIYEATTNLETLILESNKAFFPFQSKINGRSFPTHFLDHSLKTLHIPIWGDQASNLHIYARNCVWLFQSVRT